MCYLNNYEDTQSIVAEFKKFKGVRYSKEIGRMSPTLKLTKLIAINKVKITIISSLKKIPVLFIQFPEINGIGFQFRQSNGIEFQFREVDGIETNSVNHGIDEHNDCCVLITSGLQQ